MNAITYRAAAISLIIRLTGCPTSWAEEVCDEVTAADWFVSWNDGNSNAIVACYVAAALLDHGFAGDGTYYGDEEYKPAWL